MEPTENRRSLKYIKVGKSDELLTLRENVTRVEHDISNYVRKQMHRGVVTCEVIGQATLFQEEMHQEMSIIEEQLMSEAGFEEQEAFRVRW